MQQCYTPAKAGRVTRIKRRRADVAGAGDAALNSLSGAGKDVKRPRAPRVRSPQRAHLSALADNAAPNAQ
jgi:hypothetical protein